MKEPAPASPDLAPILLRLRAEPSRTWSLIVTLFGDAVVPRGGRLWLGTLLEIFDALDIGGNVVRTAASRLAADGWLERNRVGRNSYYRLADKGRHTFADAARRIYGRSRPAWDGVFHLAVLGDANAREPLQGRGYAPLAPGILIGAEPPGPGFGIIHLRAETDPASARLLAAQIWPTNRLAEGYGAFNASFADLAPATLGDRDALLARLLLIHQYRRLALRDPLLADALLPEHWPGHAAFDLCARLYLELLPASERWLDRHARNEDGPLPAPDDALLRRFGG